MKENYGFETTDPDTVNAIDTIIMPVKPMMGTPWYTILSNPNYYMEMNYIGAQINEREKLIEDGFNDESEPNPKNPKLS